MSKLKLKLGEKMVSVAVNKKLWAQVKYLADERDVNVSKILNEILTTSFKSGKEAK